MVKVFGQQKHSKAFDCHILWRFAQRFHDSFDGLADKHFLCVPLWYAGIYFQPIVQIRQISDTDITTTYLCSVVDSRNWVTTEFIRRNFKGYGGNTRSRH